MDSEENIIYKRNPSSSDSTTGNPNLVKQEKVSGGLEAKIEQLEIIYNLKTSKLENDHKLFEERINNSLSNMRWLAGFGVTFVALAFGVGTYISEQSINRNQQYYDLQKDYYTELLRVSVDKGSTDKRLEVNDEIMKCLKNKKYWQYQDCL